MVFEHFSLGFFRGEIHCFSVEFSFHVGKIRILFQPGETCRVFSMFWEQEHLQSPSLALSSAVQVICCRKQGQRSALELGKGRGISLQKSILILAWPVIYFSIAKINKGIFILPLHKPGL